ncbi:MAG: ribonuclease P protein component [Pseudomonadales bacterium]|nr:ribonuclease P protein component [Pseudomonadales bacterium]
MVFKKNNYRMGSSEFLILAMDTQNESSRLGMVIGKRNTALAVNRNLIKRLIRESFRRKFPKNIAIDIVIVSRQGINKAHNIELLERLESAWNKLAKKVVKNYQTGSKHD